MRTKGLDAFSKAIISWMDEVCPCPWLGKYKDHFDPPLLSYNFTTCLDVQGNRQRPDEQKAWSSKFLLDQEGVKDI